MRALTDPDMRFIPFFGSSEWMRFDNMHPAVLAEKYNRSYRPYFMGQAGAASLSQYFGMQQITSELENKQAVFVISPQWFTKEDHDPTIFQTYFNNDQLTAFLENQSGDVASQFAANRLLKQNPGISLKGIVEKLAKNEQLSDFDHSIITASAEFNEKQSALFGQFSIRGRLRYKDHVEKYLGNLPDQFSYEELDMIESFVKQPIRQLKLSKYYSVDIYEEVNISEPQIIGVDVSGGYRRDNSAFVAINSKTTKVQAVFKNPKIGPTELSKLLLEYVTTYSPNAVIVVERNSYGEGVIGNLRNSSIYNNLYYTINNNDPTREKTRDGWSMQSSSITKDYGIYTTKEVRERMHDLLRDRVIDHPDKFISPVILDEMKGLIWDTKHNRIDHSANTHDDTIMAYLMALYMIYYSGTNILNFGIARRDIPRFGDEYGIESVEDITSQVIDPIMRVEQDEYMKTLFGTPRKTVMDYVRETEDQRAYELAVMDSGKNVDNGYILQTNVMKINNAINAAMLSPLDINPGMAQTMGGNFIVDMEPDNLANIFMGNMDTF